MMFSFWYLLGKEAWRSTKNHSRILNFWSESRDLTTSVSSLNFLSLIVKLLDEVASRVLLEGPSLKDWVGV